MPPTSAKATASTRRAADPSSTTSASSTSTTPTPAHLYDRAYLQDPHWSISLWDSTHTGPYTDPNDPRFNLVCVTTIDFLNATLKGHPESLIYMAMEVVNRPDLGGFE